MQLKSPTHQAVHVALLSGHSIVIGPEGRDVPKEFVKEALIRGAIPVGEQAEQAPDTSGDRMKAIIAGVKTMLVSAPDKFTDDGLPNRKTLGQVVGFSVSAEEASSAMVALESEAD